MRSRTKGKQRRTIAQIAKGFIQKLAFKGLVHLVTLARDAFERGAPIEDLKAFSREYDSIVEGWYADRLSQQLPALELVHRAEEHEEAMKEECETAFSYSRTPFNAARLLAAIERHTNADGQLARVARAVLGGATV